MSERGEQREGVAWEKFFDHMREIAERVNLTDAEAMLLAEEAVQAVRRQDA